MFDELTVQGHSLDRISIRGLCAKRVFFKMRVVCRRIPVVYGVRAVTRAVVLPSALFLMVFTHTNLRVLSSSLRCWLNGLLLCVAL